MHQEPGYVLAGVLLAVLVVTAGAAAGAAGAATPGMTSSVGRATVGTSSLVVPAGPTATAAPSAEGAASADASATTVTPVVREVVVHAAASWVQTTGTATGIPMRAVQAYGDATLASRGSDPACGLGWTTLAAIGKVESGHGHGELQDDGRPTVPVVGPALDGSAGVAAIRATAESTAWHGDPVWDHAVGPMQFLPSTWQRWGADGDGDGQADPNDLDDAALAAAHYLCAAGGDLTSPVGWSAGVRAYNHDDAYVAAVLAVADGYARAAGG